MDEKELAEIEKYKSALWVNNLLSPSADGLICNLIAEVRRLNAEMEELKRKRSAIQANLSLDYLKDPFINP